jgi:hypothetical protein
MPIDARAGSSGVENCQFEQLYREPKKEDYSAWLNGPGSRGDA